MNLDLRTPQQDGMPEYFAFHHALAAERPKGRHFTKDEDIAYAWQRAMDSVGGNERIHRVCWESSNIIIGECFTYGTPDEPYTGIIFLQDRCGYGFGVLCMDVLVQFAKAQRWEALYSNVWEDNGAALRLNLRYGYECVNYRFVRHPYRERRDVIVWTLRLDLMQDLQRK